MTEELDPYNAYNRAVVHKAPSDYTRAVASGDPNFAYLYARDVDKGPHLVTRESVKNSPKWLYWYIKDVDNGRIYPIMFDAVKEFAENGDPYAKNALEEFEIVPPDEEKNIIDPKEAFFFAYSYGGSDYLREVASKDPMYAYYYAYKVDGGTPHPVTREGVKGDPEYIYFYVMSIDGRKIHPVFENVLKASVLMGSKWGIRTISEFGDRK